jgi:hypothetical protein
MSLHVLTGIVTQSPCELQVDPAGHVPQLFPQPSTPQCLPMHVHVLCVQRLLTQLLPAGQMAQGFPHPSDPQKPGQ